MQEASGLAQISRCFAGLNHSTDSISLGCIEREGSEEQNVLQLFRHRKGQM